MLIKRDIFINRIKKYSFIYKKITNNFYLCRLYSNRILHPIGYHIILPFIIID